LEDFGYRCIQTQLALLHLHAWIIIWSRIVSPFK
jgi:hypothetical protein